MKTQKENRRYYIMKKQFNKIKFTKAERSLKICAAVVTFFFCAIMLYPLLFTASNAAKDNVKIYDVPPSILPDSPQSLSLVMDYSKLDQTGEELLDTIKKDNVLSMFSTMRKLSKDSIFEIKFYGVKDNKIIFKSRVHQMKLQLEMDYGIYMGTVVKANVLLNEDRYLRANDSIGYEYNENGLGETPDLSGMNGSYTQQLSSHLTEEFNVEGTLLSSGTKTNNFLLLESFKYYLQMPSYAYPQNELVAKYSFAIFVMNSVIVIGWAIVTQIILCSIAAFVISRLLTPRTGKLVLLFFLGGMMIPFASIMIPQLIMYKNLGFYNNYWALLIPFLCPYGFYIYLYKGFFDKIPGSYFEAGRLDGASNLYLYYNICMPLSKPIIFMIGLQTFISNWNDFFWAWMVTENQKLWTLNVALFNLSKNANTKQNFIMGLSIVTILPVLLLTIFFSKQLKESILAAGVKG